MSGMNRSGAESWGGKNLKCGLKTGVIRPEILTCGWSLDSEETGGKMWGGGYTLSAYKNNGMVLQGGLCDIIARPFPALYNSLQSMTSSAAHSVKTISFLGGLVSRWVNDMGGAVCQPPRYKHYFISSIMFIGDGSDWVGGKLSLNISPWVEWG